MAALKSKPTASAAEVREFAGIPSTQHGRLSRATIEAYNKAHPARKYVEGTPASQPVKFQSPNGRVVTRAVIVEQARAALLAAGEPVGSKGPLSREHLIAVASGKVPLPA